MTTMLFVDGEEAGEVINMRFHSDGVLESKITEAKQFVLDACVNYPVKGEFTIFCKPYFFEKIYKRINKFRKERYTARQKFLKKRGAR